MDLPVFAPDVVAHRGRRLLCHRHLAYIDLSSKQHPPEQKLTLAFYWAGGRALAPWVSGSSGAEGERQLVVAPGNRGARQRAGEGARSLWDRLPGVSACWTAEDSASFSASGQFRKVPQGAMSDMAGSATYW